MASATLTLPSDRKAFVLYDGECPLCQRSVAVLKRLDWQERLSYINARDQAQWPQTPVHLDREKMLEEMHLLTPDHQSVLTGFDAFRWISARVPLLWALWPLLYLPGVPQLGRAVYRWIAKNRFHLVPCHDGQCQLPPSHGSNTDQSQSAKSTA